MSRATINEHANCLVHLSTLFYFINVSSSRKKKTFLYVCHVVNLGKQNNNIENNSSAIKRIFSVPKLTEMARQILAAHIFRTWLVLIWARAPEVMLSRRTQALKRPPGVLMMERNPPLPGNVAAFFFASIFFETRLRRQRHFRESLEIIISKFQLVRWQTSTLFLSPCTTMFVFWCSHYERF